MSLEDTVEAIVRTVDKIEGHVTSMNNGQYMIECMKSFTVERKECMDLVEVEEGIQRAYKTLLQERKEYISRQKSLVEKSLNKLEKLNHAKALIQDRIELIENHLKNNIVESNDSLTKKLEDKRNCIFAWRFLTGVNFHFSEKPVLGYHFNEKTGKHITFKIAKDSDCTEKLWTIISKNMKEDA